MMDSNEELYLLFTLITGLITFCSWLAFGRLVMARVERHIKDEGLPRPCSWDGSGARVLSYAYALVLPAERVDMRLIDARIVKRYSTPADRVLGLTLILSSTLLGLLCLIGGFLLNLD